MIATPITPELVRGAAELETTDRGIRPHRLPRRVRTRFPDPQLLAMEAQPSGVRLAMVTDATRIELTVHPSRVAYLGLDRPRGRIDAAVDGEIVLRDVLSGGDETRVDPATGSSTVHPGPSHTTSLADLPPWLKRVEIWLPHNKSVELVELLSDEPLLSASNDAPVWVHHGSSISQGSNAAGPTDIWPVVAARKSGVGSRVA